MTRFGVSKSITEGILPACEDCIPRLEEQTYLLTTWVAIGRLSTEKAIRIINERPCEHIDIAQFLGAVTQPQSL